MTAKQIIDTSAPFRWVITILFGVIAFLLGSNTSGVFNSAELKKHEKIKGHPVMEERMNSVEIDIKEHDKEHKEQLTSINDKLDYLILKSK